MHRAYFESDPASLKKAYCIILCFLFTQLHIKSIFFIVHNRQTILPLSKHTVVSPLMDENIC